ncbi:hypothetical protein EXIGLDRAFT_836993 [Exidia glandulosa HHB12029]|uniref:Uncharacterized protein n=1 Tax=Exidia glandulosa HHB12029 TaxID=1314781 RepID=A0A166AGA9_EXIGL|nr:hypothetical protein EXIGLDRAFT_836993 [Exidia glandulosa HHB12029]
MALVQQGSRCATCGIVDFLPIVCTACTNEYCRDHIHQHVCTPAPAQPATPDRDAPVTHLARCALESCDNPSLDSMSSQSSVLCDACKLAFCAYHREPASHNCVPLPQEPVPQRNAEAHALLRRYFLDIPQRSSASSQSSSRISRPPADPARSARYEALEMMKLRHRAKPADTREPNLAQHNRVHVRVNQLGRPAADNKLLWFKKSISAGRAIDLCAALYNIPRDHNSPQLALFAVQPSDRSALVRLENERALEDQVTDGLNLILAPADTAAASTTTAE